MTMSEHKPGAAGARRFEFERDSFAFANELRWEYRPDPEAGGLRFGKREPKPAYTLRCFVLTRAARQFLYHARFEANLAAVNEESYQRLIRQVVHRPRPSPATTSSPGRRRRTSRRWWASSAATRGAVGSSTNTMAAAPAPAGPVRVN